MRSRSDESGFSLAELLVAMVVTTIISGAIYATMVMGQRQFRRDPEVVERQQNIRTAMDMIVRDVSNAGVGMPAFLQTFASDLNSVGTLDSPIEADKTDEIQLVSNPSGMDFEDTCFYPGDRAATVFMKNHGTEIRPGKLVIVFMQDGTWTLRYVTDIGENSSSAGDNCEQGTRRAKLNFSKGLDPNDPPLDTPGGLCEDNGTGTAHLSPECIPMAVGDGEMVKYWIAEDPVDKVPVLMRLASGSVTNGVFRNGAAMLGQVVARGIEDLQVQYAVAGAPDKFEDSAPKVDFLNRDYRTLTTKVKITLSARTASRKLVGAVVDDSGGAETSAIRGRLTTTVAIRTNLNHLTKADEEGKPILWQ